MWVRTIVCENKKINETEVHKVFFKYEEAFLLGIASSENEKLEQFSV